MDLCENNIYSNNIIINAKYGILDQYIDVTDIINKLLLTDNKININTQTFNYDPYFGKIKELVVTLNSGDQYTYYDNSTLTNVITESASASASASASTSTSTSTSASTSTSTSASTSASTTTKVDIPNVDILKQSRTFDYIVSTNARDEAGILEWIIYHLLIGFDKVVIIDHLSIIPIKTLIEPYYWKHKVEVIRSEMQGPVKMFFLNKVIIPYMTKHCKKYFIHLDADEYIYIKNNLTIDKLLLNYNNKNIITLNWLMFGSNNKLTNDNEHKCLIPTYTRAANNISDHYKCFIKINRAFTFSYINPHQIIYTNNNTLYTSINNKDIMFNGNVIKNFGDMMPTCDVETLPAYLIHYFVQSTEDYLHRKINRNRDDIMAKRESDNNIHGNFNDIENTNIVHFYPKIKDIIENYKYSIGFVMIRHVCSNETNIAWQNCYNSIRQFYNNKIVIIDDNSNPQYLTTIELINTTIINSEFPKRGELLPYYYFIKNKFFDRMIVIHDSMSIKQYFDFDKINRYKNYTRLFSFGNNAYQIDIKYFKEMTQYLKGGNILYQYHLNNIKRLIGCFGICYVIDHTYLLEIERKYNISNLVNYVDTRPKRQTLERLLSCLFEMDKSMNNFTTPDDLFGSIFINNNNYIEKKFFGR